MIPWAQLTHHPKRSLINWLIIAGLMPHSSICAIASPPILPLPVEALVLQLTHGALDQDDPASQTASH